MREELAPGEEAAIARRLLHTVDCGVLSTMSVEMEGFPFGSITPFVMTHDGHVVVLVSDIAQHTKNMQADEKVCFTVMDHAGGNKQEQGRATVVGRARPVPQEEVAEARQRYFAFFPEARHYSQAHDFTFFRIEAERIRYIGGFGKIFWIEKEDWSLGRPSWVQDEEKSIVHMNEDHQDALNEIARVFTNMQDGDAKLVAADGEGCHLKTSTGIHYVPFAAPAIEENSLREALVTLAKRARTK